MGNKKSAQKAAATKAEKRRVALLAAQGPYTPPATISYTTQLRPRVNEGEEFSVHSFDFTAAANSANSLPAKVTALWGKGTSGATVICRGMALPASTLLTRAGITDPAGFIEDGVAKLVQHALANNGTRPHPLIFGEDNPGTKKEPKALLSEGERLTRLIEAIVIGAGELHLRGHRVTGMFDQLMLPATAGFVRKQVTWDGKENGTIFELANAFDLSVIPLRSGQPVRLGIKMPNAKKYERELRFGYDGGLLRADNVIVPVQVKAIAMKDLSSEAAVSYQKTKNGYFTRIDCGNEPLRQAFEDGVRIRPWGHMLPDTRVVTDPAPTIAWNPNRPDWWRVHPTTVFRFSAEQAIAEAHEAVFLGRNAGAPMLPVSGVGLPLSLRDVMVAKFGAQIPATMPYADFVTGMQECLSQVSLQWQAHINQQLRYAKQRDHMVYKGANPLGHWDSTTYPEIRLVGSHDAARLQAVLTELDLI